MRMTPKLPVWDAHNPRTRIRQQSALQPLRSARRRASDPAVSDSDPMPATLVAVRFVHAIDEAGNWIEARPEETPDQSPGQPGRLVPYKCRSERTFSGASNDARRFEG